MRIPFKLKLVAVAASSAVLAACSDGGGGGGGAGGGGSSEFVQKAALCGSTDKPETGLQGQVPAALRASGFAGFNCNLRLVGQLPGEGGNWSSATYKSETSSQQHCAYYATATPNAQRQNPGVPVIDMSVATNPVFKTALTTPAMQDPWESLRVHTQRKLLIADNGQNGGGGPEVDVYDISADCRAPQLLASIPVGTGADGGVTLPQAPVGHEGNISPDGLTYYIGDIRRAAYHAVDITNPSRPRLIATYPIANLGLRTGTTVHGLSVSNDGNRLYAVVLGFPPAGGIAEGSQINNGFAIFDTSEVQQRKPNAQIKLLSTALFQDGSVAQHTIPVRIAGTQYLVHVDEGGSAGLADAANARRACDAGLAPFPLARIYDISDELNPTLVSKLKLETHDPKNCAQVTADIAGLSIFTYGSHYCSVDNRDNATVLACSYFNSGVRVFDIRNPGRPVEIAYFNPPSAPSRPGSSHARFGQWRAGGPDWCASRLDFDFANRRLTTMCQDNGLLVMEFARGYWPFPESTPSTNQN